MIDAGNRQKSSHTINFCSFRQQFDKLFGEAENRLLYLHWSFSYNQSIVNRRD